MRVLIDTHVVLWFLAGDRRLPPKYRQMLIGDSDELFFSAASAAEISTKYASRKLSLPEPPIDLIPQVMTDLRLLPLSITMDHGLTLSRLPIHHGDPFDRLLIAQAICEQIPIVSGDREFGRYGVEVIW